MKEIKFYLLAVLALTLRALGIALATPGVMLYDLGEQVSKAACEMGKELAYDHR